MPFYRLLLLLPVLLVLTAGGKLQAAPLTLRVAADGGEIEFYHRGRKLSDSRLEQLCAAAKRNKDEIVFDRDKMTSDDALAAILKEAQCLGATHSGLTKIDREPASKSVSHKRAKPRHKAKARR